MTSPNDWLKEPLANFRVHVHHGITIRPKWYDFPRRLGWRAKKRDTFMKGCEVVVDRPNHIIYCTPAMEQRLRAALPHV